MSHRELSMTPSATRARERRFDAMVIREEQKIHTEVKSFMDEGLSFEEAWVSAGNLIVPLRTVAA